MKNDERMELSKVEDDSLGQEREFMSLLNRPEGPS